MKEKIQFVIATILLSIGIAVVLYNAKFIMLATAREIRSTVNYHVQQGGTNTLSEHRYLSKRFSPQWQQSTIHRFSLSKGKSPALLWHHFSLTPQPVYFHWLMAMRLNTDYQCSECL